VGKKCQITGQNFWNKGSTYTLNTHFSIIFLVECRLSQFDESNHNKFKLKPSCHSCVDIVKTFDLVHQRLKRRVVLKFVGFLMLNFHSCCISFWNLWIEMKVGEVHSKRVMVWAVVANCFGSTRWATTCYILAFPCYIKCINMRHWHLQLVAE